MLSENVNEWGVPTRYKKTEEVKPIQKVEEHVTVLEDLHMTLRFLSEVVEAPKMEITSSDQDEPGKWTTSLKIHAGDLSPLVTAAQEIADKNEDDVESVLSDLLDLEKMTKELDKAMWNEVRHLGSFSGASVEFTGYPQSIEDFKNAEFELTVVLDYSKPSDISLEKVLNKVLKQSMKWWV